MCPVVDQHLVQREYQLHALCCLGEAPRESHEVKWSEDGWICLNCNKSLSAVGYRYSYVFQHVEVTISCF